jgi:7-cyano-7-deazaguanine reductase
VEPVTLVGQLVLGRTHREPIGADELARQRFETPEGIREVTMATEEGTSSCPVTGQPDFWSVEIRYVPHRWCLESKALKLYLWGFRDRNAFAEALAAEIAEAVARAIEPISVEVRLVQRPRGGVGIVAVARMNA